jgi:prefoldin subunit 5
MDWTGLVAIVMIFGTGMLGVIAFSPIGRAISLAIQKKSGVVGVSPEMQDAVDELAERFEALQRQVGELAERQDFAERLLAKAREKGALPAPKEP